MSPALPFLAAAEPSLHNVVSEVSIWFGGIFLIFAVLLWLLVPKSVDSEIITWLLAITAAILGFAFLWVGGVTGPGILGLAVGIFYALLAWKCAGAGIEGRKTSLFLGVLGCALALLAAVIDANV